MSYFAGDGNKAIEKDTYDEKASEKELKISAKLAIRRHSVCNC